MFPNLRRFWSHPHGELWVGSLNDAAFVDVSVPTRPQLKPQAQKKLLALIAHVLGEDVEESQERCTVVAWTPDSATTSLARALKNPREWQGNRGAAPGNTEEKEVRYTGTTPFVIVSPGEAYRSQTLLTWAENMARGRTKEADEPAAVKDAKEIFKSRIIKIEALDEKYVSLSLQSGIRAWAGRVWNWICSRLAPNEATGYESLDTLSA